MQVGTIPVMPLQVLCDASDNFKDHLVNFEFVEAFACTYANQVGFLVLGLIVYGAIAGSIYIRTNSFILPFGLLLVTGGAVISQMASVAIPIAVLLILVIPAAVTAYLYASYSR